MPTFILPSPQAKQDAELVASIVTELKLGEQSPNTEPRILLVGDATYGNLEAYVIWKAWEGVGHARRGDIILKALERHFGRDWTLGVSVTLGLTPLEAESHKLPQVG